MSKREIASLACKLLGLYLMIQGLNVMINMFSVSLMPYNPLSMEKILNTIFPFIFIIIFGILIWSFSDKLSVIMIKGETCSEERTSIKASDIQRIAFSVLGLYFLGNSIPKLISTIINITSKEVANYSSVLFLAGGPITQFIVGFAIFTGSEGLVNFLKRLRTTGVTRENDHDGINNE